MKLSTSPDRYSFAKTNLLKRLADGETTQEYTDQMLEFYNSYNDEIERQQSSPEWISDNMEYDLRTTAWILTKVRNSIAYSQNLYAALCNRTFRKHGSDKSWSCSWRYAGGIIAHMREQGDYMDWYCSGIRDDIDLTDDDILSMPESSREYAIASRSFVPESDTTDEILSDLATLGWEMID